MNEMELHHPPHPLWERGITAQLVPSYQGQSCSIVKKTSAERGPGYGFYDEDFESLTFFVPDFVEMVGRFFLLLRSGCNERLLDFAGDRRDITTALYDVSFSIESIDWDLTCFNCRKSTY